MPQQPQPKQWVVDFSSIVASLSQGVAAVLGTQGQGRQGGQNPLNIPNCPEGYIMQDGRCVSLSGDADEPIDCPPGFKYKDGTCVKKSNTLLWVGIGVVVVAGSFFAYTKFKKP